MPKVATALGVWIAVILSIGFNIFHYPVVWEMTTAANHPLDKQTTTVARAAEDASRGAGATSSTLASRTAGSDSGAATDRAASSETSAKPENHNGYRVQCDGQSCKLVPVEPAPSSVASASSTPSGEPAAGHAPANADSPATIDAEKTAGLPAPQTQPSPSLAGSKPGSAGVVRLPPVTPDSPGASLPVVTDARIPVYATTGM